MSETSPAQKTAGESHSCSNVCYENGCSSRERRLLQRPQRNGPRVRDLRESKTVRSIASQRWNAPARIPERDTPPRSHRQTNNTSQATDAAVADATAAVADVTVEEAPKKPEIKIVEDDERRSC